MIVISAPVSTSPHAGTPMITQAWRGLLPLSRMRVGAILSVAGCGAAGICSTHSVPCEHTWLVCATPVAVSELGLLGPCCLAGQVLAKCPG